METTLAERFRWQHCSLSLDVEDLLQECEILRADPIVARSWIQVDVPRVAPANSEHWELFLDQACNRGLDLDGDFVDRSEWLYEDCYLSDQRIRSGYWWHDRETTPALDIRFIH